MSYSSVLVCVDPGPATDIRLKMAGDLAKRLNAHVIGVAAGDVVAPMYFADGAYAAGLIERERAEIESELGKLEKRFLAALPNLAGRIEWHAAVRPLLWHVVARAHCADLLIVGSDQAGENLRPIWRMDNGDLVMAAGRPVLVVPRSAAAEAPKKIVVAWKESREARRALFDAVPLLRLATDVSLVAMLEGDDSREVVTNQLGDVGRWLDRHGVRSSARCERAAAGASEGLLTIATESGAEAIVAGAYGHSRVGEWAFGGVTRDLLARWPRSLLMSH